MKDALIMPTRSSLSWVTTTTQAEARHVFRFLCCVLLVSVVALSVATAAAQESGNVAHSSNRLRNGRISGELDSDISAPLAGYISTPANSQPTLQDETGAPQVSAPAWQGMEATGTISYGKHGQPLPVTLSISANGAERLDVTLVDGIRSLRVLSFIGKLRDSRGPVRQLPLRNTIVSFLPLQPFSSKNLPAYTTSSSMDQARLGGQTYQHTRYEYRPARIADPTKRGLPAFATEMYVSPATGLIYKSADYVQSLETSPESYIRVITYEDYKTVDGSSVPTRITQSVDGQPSFVLQLNDIHLGSTRPLSDFTF